MTNGESSAKQLLGRGKERAEGKQHPARQSSILAANRNRTAQQRSTWTVLTLERDTQPQHPMPRASFNLKKRPQYSTASPLARQNVSPVFLRNENENLAEELITGDR